MNINSIFKMIVVSFILTTIIACSSVRKNKTRTEEIIDRTEKVTSDVKETEKTSTQTVTDTKGTIKRDNLSIDYTPKFDTFGNLIPFSFQKKDANGNETSVNISGNANVNYTTDEEVKDIVESSKTDTSKEVTRLEETIKQLEEKITKLEKNKTVAPDYLKFIIWIGIGLLLLAGIVVAIFLYVKSKLKIIKTFIP